MEDEHEAAAGRLVAARLPGPLEKSLLETETDRLRSAVRVDVLDEPFEAVPAFTLRGDIKLEAKLVRELFVVADLQK